MKWDMLDIYNIIKPPLHFLKPKKSSVFLAELLNTWIKQIKMSVGLIYVRRHLLLVFIFRM